MKNTRYIPFLSFLLASLALASSTMAQTTEDRQTEENTRSIDSIAAARSQYTQTPEISSDADNTKLAQLHRSGPGRPFPPQRGYPRRIYQTPWVDHGNAGHIFIGAAIGFGIGAALGANNSARSGTPVAGGIIVGGGLFGLLGGCVGKAVGDLQGIQYSSARRRRTYRPSWPEDDEQSDRGSPSKARRQHQQEASAKPASLGQQAEVATMAQASPLAAVP
jgi:hypothetical protein